MSGDFALLSASDLARRIRGGTATAREAVEACLARIDRFDHKLNAFIALDAAHMRRTAVLADAEAKRVRFLGAVHGVPLVHKDMHYRQGLIATCGSKVRNEWIATATVLTRLDAAGALDLGTFNMHK